MPLNPTDVPAEVDPFGIRFMMRGFRGPVRCHVFREALDQIGGGHAKSSEDLLGRFRRNRRQLERLASRLYDAGHQTPWIGVNDLLTGIGPDDFDEPDAS